MIDELKTFIAVVKCENFTKAGELINLSQPSVSLHIKRLEEHFETKLIQRSIKQKNILITQPGKLLYERAKQIINLLEETKIELSDYSKVIGGTLRIGASFTIGEYFLPSFLGEFDKKYPNLELKITIENTTNICNKVKNLELDLGLIEGLVPSFDFVHDYFYEDTMVLAVPYNHILARKNFSPQEFKNQTWISREEGSGTRDYLNFFLTSNNIHPKNIIVFGSNYSVKEAVKNNLGLTFISSYVVNNSVKAKEISIIDTNQKYTRHYSYILPKSSIISKGAEVFIDVLKDINTKKDASI